MNKDTSKSMVVAKNNHPAPTTSKLTDKEQTELKECEKIITQNYQSAFELAQALHKIHDKKLYRAEYKTFEEYCSKKWEYSRSYCSRLITMDQVVTDLKQLPDSKDAIIRNESQARVFIDLEKPDRIKLLDKAKEIDEPETITAKILTKLKKELFPEKCAAKTNKGAAEKPVVDVEEVAGSMPPAPVISKVVDLAQTLLDDLIYNEGDDCDLGTELRAFIKESEAWLAYQKANKK